MYKCGKLKKVIGNKFLFPVILKQCAARPIQPFWEDCFALGSSNSEGAQ